MPKKCFLCDSDDSVIDFNDETFANCSMKLAFRKKKHFKYNEDELTEASLDYIGYHTACYKKVTVLAKKYNEEFKIFITENTKLDESLLDHNYQLENDNSQNMNMATNNVIITEEYDCDPYIKTEQESYEDFDLESSAPTYESELEPGSTNLEQVKTYSVETSTEPIDSEEITAFTNFINCKMKKYSEKTIKAVEKAVFDIIIKADRNFYEDDNNERLESRNNKNKTRKRQIPSKRKLLRVKKPKRIILAKEKDIQDGDSSE